MSYLKTKRVQLGDNVTASNNFVLRQPDTADGTMRISNGIVGAETDLVTVTSAGNVGIGTSSPSVKLHVKSASYPYVRVTNDGYTGLDIGQADSDAGGAGLIKLRDSAPMLFYTADLERMRIDSAGRVTMPYQPAFSVYANTNETTGAGGIAPFNGIIFDQGNNYSTANRRFVAPVAGIYQFSTYGNVNGVSAGSPIISAFAVNGTYRGAYMYLTVPTGAGSWILISGTQTIKLVANDYVEVKAVVSMHWDYGSAVWSNFSGHLVG